MSKNKTGWFRKFFLPNFELEKPTTRGSVVFQLDLIKGKYEASKSEANKDLPGGESIFDPLENGFLEMSDKKIDAFLAAFHVKLRKTRVLKTWRAGRLLNHIIPYVVTGVFIASLVLCLYGGGAFNASSDAEIFRSETKQKAIAIVGVVLLYVVLVLTLAFPLIFHYEVTSRARNQAELMVQTFNEDYDTAPIKFEKNVEKYNEDNNRKEIDDNKRIFREKLREYLQRRGGCRKCEDCERLLRKPVKIAAVQGAEFIEFYFDP